MYEPSLKESSWYEPAEEERYELSEEECDLIRRRYHDFLDDLIEELGLTHDDEELVTEEFR